MTFVSVAIGPAPHRVSRALWARNPGRGRKESGKSTPRQDPKSVERVHPRVTKESDKSPKPDVLDSFRTLLRLRSALFRHFWGPVPGYSFRTLFRLFRARETLCGAGPIAMSVVILSSPVLLLLSIGSVFVLSSLIRACFSFTGWVTQSPLRFGFRLCFVNTDQAHLHHQRGFAAPVLTVFPSPPLSIGIIRFATSLCLPSLARRHCFLFCILSRFRWVGGCFCFLLLFVILHVVLGKQVCQWHNDRSHHLFVSWLPPKNRTVSRVRCFLGIVFAT